MQNDIVDRLRLYSDRMKETRSTVLGLLLSDAADEIERLRAERDKARKNVLELMHPDSRHGYITAMEWDCFNTPEVKVDKTLNGVIVDGGKAVPPKYEDLDNV